MARKPSRSGRRKIAYIGASYLFTHTSVRDMLLNGHLDDTDIAIWDIDPEPLEIETALIGRMIRQRGSPMTVRKARSRRDALDGADYVVVSVLAGDLGVVAAEDRICRRHGIRHTVGDTVGPMSTARLLRQAPLLVDIARDMERLCPAAPMLSPTNPMASLVTAVTRYTGVTCVGICHGTHFALGAIARSYGVPATDVEANLVGVNHFALIDRVKVRGRDIPVERVIRKIERAVKQDYLDSAGQVDRSEMAFDYASHVGFLPNNGDHHFIEFFPWYLAPHAFDAAGHNRHGLDERLLNVPARKRRKRQLRKLLSGWARRRADVPDMGEYGSDYIQDVILGLEGRKRDMTLPQMHLNVPNGRSVPNLPADAVLEVAVRFAGGRVRPVSNPPLDTYRWGVFSRLVAQNDLAARAAIERDRKAFVQALLLDPLLHRFETVGKLADELWEVNRPLMKPRR